jgi:hypothetical protein
MNEQASEALGRVIRNYGPAICNTPRSCEMFIRQECGAYPDESKALIEALRQGVTADLLTYRPGESPWDGFADQLRTRLRSRSGLGETEGAWAVDTWARALGRHPETQADAPLVQSAVPLKPGATARQLKIAMTAVVTSGGALGTALGTILIPGALLITEASVKMPMMSQRITSSSRFDVWTMVILVLLFLAAIGGLAGAIGSALGWIYGRGESGHWQAFGTSFGAGFASAALGYWFCGIFGSCLGGLISTFGASTTTARRGGFG